MTTTNDGDKVTNENGKGNGGKRNRRTREQIKAELEAKLAKINAKLNGTFVETDDESLLVKRLRRAIRKRETAIGNAGTLLTGRAATEKSPAIPTIDSKIENAQKRLDDLRLAKNRAMEIQARVPFDIDRLRSALEGAEKGTVLEFPTELYILPGEDEKTDAEHEAASVSEQDD